MEERNEVILKSLKDLLAEGKTLVAVALLDSLHPADAAEIVEELSQEDRIKIFQTWDVRESSEAVEEMSEEEQVELVGGLSSQLALRIITQMSPDDAVDLLNRLPREIREDLLMGMDLELSGKLRRLLAHGERTAGGLMTPNAVRMPEDLLVSEVLEKLRKVPPEIEMVYYVYFLDDEQKLTGVASLRELIVADPDRPVKEIMHRDIIFAGPDADQEEVAQLIDRYDLLALPVLDKGQRLLGIVTVDDAMEVIEEEAKEDLYSLAGTWESEEERERHPLYAALKGRLPWLLGALLLELLLAGAVLKGYAWLFERHLALVLFMPAVMFLGGTIAVLSSTHVTHNVLAADAPPVSLSHSLVSECLIGIALGIFSSSLLFLVAWAVERDFRISWSVGISSLVSMVCASLIGTTLPWGLKRVGGDPAKASEPLLATIMDLVVILIYVGFGLLVVQR